MEVELSKNAERVLLFHYVKAKGALPDWAEGNDIQVFCRISGITESDACAAYAELQNKGMLDRED